MPIRRHAPAAILVAVLTALTAAIATAQPEGDRPRRPDGPPPGGRSPAEMISRADKDGDGRVSRKEFIETRTAEMESMFDRIDGNGDGFLDEREVGEMAERMRAGAESMQRPGGERFRRPDGPRPEGGRPEGAPRAGEAFDRMDGNGDGSLSREEFTAGMERLREVMQRGGTGRPDGRRGPEEGFRRPPRQDGESSSGGSAAP